MRKLNLIESKLNVFSMNYHERRIYLELSLAFEQETVAVNMVNVSDFYVFDFGLYNVIESVEILNFKHLLTNPKEVYDLVFLLRKNRVRTLNEDMTQSMLDDLEKIKQGDLLLVSIESIYGMGFVALAQSCTLSKV